MEIGNVPLPISKYRIIGTVGSNIHHLLKLRVIGEFGTGVTLDQGLYRIPVDFCCHPLSLFQVRDGSVVGSVDGKLLFLQLIPFFVF